MTPEEAALRELLQSLDFSLRKWSQEGAALSFLCEHDVWVL